MELIELGAGDHKYDTAIAKFTSTIQKHNNGIQLSSYNIAKVQYIDNVDLLMVYSATKKKIELVICQPSEELILYHGTPHALKIAKEGFDINVSRSDNMLGKGIYFADISSKSNQYAWGNNHGCPNHKDKACTLCLRQVLVCSCIMGNIFEATRANTLIPEGYHSVVARPGTMLINPGWPALKYPEYSILSGDQVLPQYIIEYTINP